MKSIKEKNMIEEMKDVCKAGCLPEEASGGECYYDCKHNCGEEPICLYDIDLCDGRGEKK